MDWKIIISLVSMAFVIAGAIAAGAWMLSAWKHKLDDLEPLRKSANRIMETLDKVDVIYNIIISRFGNNMFRSNSPISLNDYGKKMSEKMNARFLVNKYINKLTEETKDMNAYQIQEHCFAFVKNQVLQDLKDSNKDMFDNITTLAFDEGVKVENLMKVLGIEIRDVILQRVGQSHEEVDKHLLAT